MKVDRFPLATAPRQRREYGIASTITVGSNEALLVAGGNKWRKRLRLTSLGPLECCIAESAIKVQRGEGMFLQPGSQPFEFTGPGELWALGLPEGRIVVDGLGTYWTWDALPLDFVVQQAETASTLLSSFEEVEA